MEEWISVERLKTVNEDEKVTRLYSWTYSPSGRYAVDFDYKEINQLEDEPDTHYYFFRFFVLDIFEKSWCPYTVNTGPFKRIYSYYWLSDRSAVLLDYSKREGSVRQNLLCFDHDEKAVSCNIIRNHDFNVESMCYSRDFTAQKLILPQGEFLLLCGYRHFEDGVFFRLVPYYPYMDISLPTDEFVIDTPSIIRSLTGDVLLHTGGHPFVYGTTMTFLLYREDLSETTYYINYTLQIDLGKALNANERRITSKYARMHVFRMPQRDWTPSLRSIPNLFNTDDYVILWEEPKRAYQRRRKGKTMVFMLDLRKNTMHITHTSLLRTDFVCIHPTCSLHIFLQTSKGIRMQAQPLPRQLPSLQKFCRQLLILTTFSVTLPVSLLQHCLFQ